MTGMPPETMYHRALGWHAPALRRAVIVASIGLIVALALLQFMTWELAAVGGWDAAALAFLAVRYDAPAPLPPAPQITALPKVAPQGLPGIGDMGSDAGGAATAAARTPERLVTCPDLATRTACLASASAQGLMVQYPNPSGDVPRYEARVPVPQGALTSLRPFPL